MKCCVTQVCELGDRPSCSGEFHEQRHIVKQGVLLQSVVKPWCEVLTEFSKLLVFSCKLMLFPHHQVCSSSSHRLSSAPALTWWQWRQQPRPQSSSHLCEVEEKKQFVLQTCPNVRFLFMQFCQTNTWITTLLYTSFVIHMLFNCRRIFCWWKTENWRKELLLVFHNKSLHYILFCCFLLYSQHRISRHWIED